MPVPHTKLHKKPCPKCNVQLAVGENHGEKHVALCHACMNVLTWDSSGGLVLMSEEEINRLDARARALLQEAKNWWLHRLN